MCAQYRVLLPKTRFPVRTNPVKHEPAVQKAANFDKLYEWQEQEKREKTFTLHDGPPYANGAPHMGHVLNKVLKDIINRYKLMRGYRLAYRPGWDCHGLPIELKACKDDDLVNRSPLQIRAKAAKYARRTIELQKKAFKRWGCLADWDNPYLTFDPEYEARQIEVFHRMYKRGCIYRGFKPVYWSPSSGTALAEAELEYQEHISRAVFILLPITSDVSSVVSGSDESLGVYALVWTTTPWTLVANEAVCFHSDHTYCIVRLRGRSGGDKLVLLGAKNIKKLAPILGDFSVESTLQGCQLTDWTYAHPITPQRNAMRFIPAEHVTEEEGTGLVHTAPTHGFVDYEVGRQSGLHLKCVVDGEGRYTSDVPADLVGLEVLGEGNDRVIGRLESSGVLLHEHCHTHRYPYDWRTRKPVIIRSTKQWFASVKELKKDAKTALQSVSLHPSSSSNLLLKMLDTRDDWCISRQRVWGVPLPIFYNEATDEPLLNDVTISHVREMIRANGSDCWWREPLDKLLPPSLAGEAECWRRGNDTMDVWFDSGSSWAAVLSDSGTSSNRSCQVADMYLEGVDQHRGWFQSSLLTGVAVQSVAPYRSLVTHGFVLDRAGAKMSKSLGNVISPDDVIDEKKFGADVMRSWVASSNYTTDISISDDILQQSSDFVQRLRNAFRFLLGNLSRFDSSSNLLPYHELTTLDRYMLHLLSCYSEEATQAYESLGFSRLPQLLSNIVPLDLSSFYFDIVKDSLYCNPPSCPTRRSTLTTFHHLLHGFVKSVAPVLPHLTEEVALHYHFPGGSVFKSGWIECPSEWSQPKLAEEFDTIRSLRSVTYKALSSARKAGSLRSFTEAQVGVVTNSEQLYRFSKRLCEIWRSVEEKRNYSLSDIFIVSHCSVELSDDVTRGGEWEGLTVYGEEREVVWGGESHRVGVGVWRAEEKGRHKCPRCWLWTADGHNHLCQRCTYVHSQTKDE